MPTGTRLTTPIPRAYLSDSRLASVTDVLARELFFRAKVTVDNLGRMPGEPAMVAGLLYPVSSPPATRTAKALRALDHAGLILWYRFGPQRFICIPDTGATQKIVGHMATTSEYPAPPKELISRWERKTGLTWQPVRVASEPKDKGSNGVRTPSEPSSNGVSSRSNGVSPSQEESCSEESCSAEPSRAEPDAPDGALSGSVARKEKNTPDRDQTFAEWLGVAGQGVLPGQYVGKQARHIFGKLAGGRYRDELDFQTHEGEAWNAFAQLVVDTFESFWDEQYRPLIGDEKFMSAVVNASHKDGRVRKGWMRILNDLRRELKSANGEVTAEAQR